MRPGHIGPPYIRTPPRTGPRNASGRLPLPCPWVHARPSAVTQLPAQTPSPASAPERKQCHCELSYPRKKSASNPPEHCDLVRDSVPVAVLSPPSRLIPVTLPGWRELGKSCLESRPRSAQYLRTPQVPSCSNKSHTYPSSLEAPKHCSTSNTHTSLLHIKETHLEVLTPALLFRQRLLTLQQCRTTGNVTPPNSTNCVCMP